MTGAPLVVPQPADDRDRLREGDTLLVTPDAAKLLGISERGFWRFRAKYLAEFPEPFYIPEATSNPKWSRLELLQFARALRDQADKAAISFARAARRLPSLRERRDPGRMRAEAAE